MQMYVISFCQCVFDSTNSRIARSFAGPEGSILKLTFDRDQDDFYPLYMNFITDFRNEDEVLLMDQKIKIEQVLSSKEYDEQLQMN